MTSATYPQRLKLLEIARRDVGRKEDSKNRAHWIGKLWEATSYGAAGYNDRAPYCAAGVAYCVREWLRLLDVRAAFGFADFTVADRWRCKSASCFHADDSWLEWAHDHATVQVLPPETILRAADLVIYTYSHIEIVSDDDGTATGPFVAIGYNTNAAAARDGEGCFEKPRTRERVKCFIRLLK